METNPQENQINQENLIQNAEEDMQIDPITIENPETIEQPIEENIIPQYNEEPQNEAAEINIEAADDIKPLDEVKINLESTFQAPIEDVSSANMTFTDQEPQKMEITSEAELQLNNSISELKSNKRKRETTTDDLVSQNPEVEKLNEHRRKLQEERKKILEQIASITQDEEDSVEEELQLFPSLQECRTLLQKLKRHKLSWPFNTPVNHVKMGLHDYLTIITEPMDLGTVGSKLKNGKYKDYKEFMLDVELVWNNCFRYNGESSDVGHMCKEVKKHYETLISKLIEETANRKTGTKKSKSSKFVFGDTQLGHVKKFVEKVKSDPASLKMPKLQFFKDFLSEFKHE